MEEVTTLHRLEGVMTIAMGKRKDFQTEGTANANGLRYLACFRHIKGPMRLE